jgi:WD40 repeat protein
MASDRQRLERVFLSAVERPPSERAAYLDRECGGDAELRLSVEQLLAAHDASGSFLDPPALPADSTGVYTPPPDDGAALPATSSAPPPTMKPGAVIAGRYTLVEQIGEGGMGEVWVARQTEPVKRNVAVKLIKPGMDSRQVLARFEAERQALALMDHPNIAKVLDGGLTPDGRPFFVMELVNGLPLTRFCDEAKLTPRERLELFVPVCRAVQHAHQKGIVHRDLKPSNILVTLYDGKPVPKVIDFGVAKATGGQLTDESIATQFGAIIGTLEYMAPEQAGFSALDVDTRADIYSLGVVLYELLTGLRPFDAQRLRKAALDELLRIIREEEPSRPSARLSTTAALPSLAALRQTEPRKLAALMRGELDWVIMKCLEKSRERRYETASGLARDIERFLADEPVEARPPSAGYRLRKFLRRHRGPLAAAAVVILALLGGVVGTSLGLVQAVDQRIQADSARRTAQDSAAELRDVRDELWTNLYASRAAQIQAAWDASQYRRARELLAAQVPAAGQQDLRGFEWYYLDRQLNADLRTVLLPRTDQQTAAISPDGTRLLRFVSEGDAHWLKMFDTATGRVVHAFRMPTDFGYATSFSPDGKWVVADVLENPVVGVASKCAVRRWSAENGEEDRRARGIETASSAFAGPEAIPAVFPAVNSGGGDWSFEYRVWDGTAVRTVRPTLKGLGFILALSPDGAVIALSRDGGDQNGCVELLDTRTGRSLSAEGEPVIPLPAGAIGPPNAFPLAFSPDGRRVAVVGETLTVWAVSPRRKVLEVADPERRETAARDRITSPVFSPDGARIAYISGPDAKIIDAATGQVRRVLVGHDGGITNLAFSRDGSVLVTAGGDRIKHWDATLDERVAALKGRRHLAPELSGRTVPSPDGTRLIESDPGGFLVWGPGKEPIFRFPPRPPVPDAVAPDPAAKPGDKQANKPRPRVGVVPDQDEQGNKFDPAGNLIIGLGSSAVSPDGHRVAWWHESAGDGGAGKEEWISRLMLWDPDAGRRLVNLDKLPGRITQAVFSPDNRWLAVVVNRAGEVRVWDAQSGRERHTLSLPRGDMFCLAFSLDGGRLGVVGSDDGTLAVRVWDSESGTQVPCPEVPLGGWGRNDVEWVPPALSAGGKRLAVPLNTDVGPGLTSGVVRVWDVETGGRTVDLRGFKRGDRMIQRLAFSPDGRRLVTSTGEQVLTIWDADTGDELLRLPAAGEVHHLAFSPDGRVIHLVVKTSAGFEARRLDGSPRAPANSP